MKVNPYCDKGQLVSFISVLFLAKLKGMTIEFHAPAGTVNEWVIDDIKKKLTELHKLDKEISRTQVYFRKRPIAFDGDYVCAIELTIYGSSIMVERSADSYRQAASHVIEELGKKVQEQLQKEKQNEPPDEIYSSVEV